MSKSYDVALSYAGEDRPFVDQVAALLKNAGLSLFYDQNLNEQAHLLGKNLHDELIDINSNRATYTVIFISKYYAQKAWTNVERKAAQARAMNQTAEYILPVRLDDTALPGLLPTVASIDARQVPAGRLAAVIIVKVRSNEGTTEVASEVSDESSMSIAARLAHRKPDVAYAGWLQTLAAAEAGQAEWPILYNRLAAAASAINTMGGGELVVPYGPFREGGYRVIALNHGLFISPENWSLDKPPAQAMPYFQTGAYEQSLPPANFGHAVHVIYYSGVSLPRAARTITGRATFNIDVVRGTRVWRDKQGRIRPSAILADTLLFQLLLNAYGDAGGTVAG